MRTSSGSIRSRVVLLMLAAVAGCSDEARECGPTGSCVPQIADVAVSEVVIVSSGRTHPVTGLPVADSIRVSYKVTNAGSIASEAVAALINVPETGAAILDTVPVLQPGQSVTRAVGGDAPYNFFDDYGNKDLVRAVVLLTPPDTDPPGNNRLVSDSVHLARPILSIVVGELAEARVRVNDPIRMSVTITNTSAIAAARDIQLRHCLWDFDVACWQGSWTAFGNVPVPDLAPGESRTVSYTTAVTATGSEEGYMHYSLSVCVTARADTDPYMLFHTFWDGSRVCVGSGLLDVWPDYEACEPPALGPQPATLTAPNCGHYPLPTVSGNWQQRYDWKKYYVFTLDAVAGRTYRVTGTADAVFRDHTGWTARDLDPAADRVRFDRTARYYLVQYGASGVHTVTVETLP